MGAFFMLKLKAKLYSYNELLALSSLMACTCQEFSVFMLSHFLPSLFYNATQQITSIHGFLNIKKVILHVLLFLSISFFIIVDFDKMFRIACRTLLHGPMQQEL